MQKGLSCRTCLLGSCAHGHADMGQKEFFLFWFFFWLGHKMQQRFKGMEGRDCLKPCMPVQSLGQAQLPQHRAGPSPISPPCQMGPSPVSRSLLSPDGGVKASSTWHLSKQAHFMPVHWKLSPTLLPKGPGVPGHQGSAKLITSASTSFPKGWSLVQSTHSNSHGRPCSLLIYYSSDSLTDTRSLSLFYGWKYGGMQLVCPAWHK